MASVTKSDVPSSQVVVLVEDNPADAKLISKALTADSNHGIEYRLVPFSRLSGAIQYLEEQPADVALLDLGLPDSRGIETFLQLHARFPRLPIVVLTGHSDDELAFQTIDSGAQDHLSKQHIGDPYFILRSLRYAIGRAKASEELLEAETRFRVVLDSASDGIVIVDRAGGVKFANRAANRLLALVPGESFPFPKNLNPDDTEEFEIATHDGTMTLAARMTGTQWKQLPAYCISIRDITDRKNAERKIIESKKAAERLSRLKSEVLASMSHEIRTPMNGVVGMTSLLLETALSDDQKVYVEAIRSSGEVLLTIINDILDFSKLEAGHFELQSTDLSIPKVIDDTLALLSEKAASKRIAMMRLVDPKVPELLRGDGVRLRQILFNLVGNALKFTPSGRVIVKVQWDDETTETVSLRFEVHDTGVGIKEKEIAKLFQPFVRGTSTSVTASEGTGLGLAISKRLVEVMGGEIGATPKPFRGSVFWFTCRLEKPKGAENFAPAEVPPAKPAETTKAAAPTPNRVFGTILVVEDNLMNQKVLHHMLKNLGYESEVVETGEAALRKVNEKEFGAILLDCQLPDMDGFETARHIRQKERDTHARHTPIIATTAYAFEEDRARCLAAGMDDYLAKPIQLATLRETLERMRGGFRPEVPRPTPPPKTRAAFDAEMLRSWQQSSSCNSEFLKEIINVYLDSTASSLPQLRDAAEAGDAKTLRQIAHKLKGASSQMGAQGMADHCAQLEESCLKGEEVKYLPLAEEIERDFGFAKGMLRDFSAQL